VPFLDENHPANRLLIVAHTARAARWNVQTPVIAAWDSVKQPYLNCGSHPDIVERVWDQLGRALPEDCRCLVWGTPALVHPKSGVVLAECYGTAYCLRLPQSADRTVSSQTTMRWSNGSVTDIAKDYGDDSVFANGARRKRRNVCSVFGSMKLFRARCRIR